MFLPDEFVDRVRSSVNIVRVVSEYVSLKKRGKNYIALCPFHSEKTPSFYVTEEKQIFHCFGCSTGGDVFKFITLIEHLPFPEAVKLVAKKYGIPLPKVSDPKPPSPDAEQRDKLLEILEETDQFFHRYLMTESEAKTGLNYLSERGILETTIKTFRIGYAPAGGDRLVRYLTSKGFPLDLIERVGVVRKSENDGSYYDYFRKRIMFPILDVSGKVIAFGGRSLGHVLPKYLNSPETPLYSKGKNLFGLNFAKDTIRNTNFAVLVEGYLDFIVPYQAGVHNVVASLGTGLTEQQVRLLGRFTRNVIVNYDPDAAGLSAAKRSLELFLQEGFKVNIALLSEGKDPDLYIREYGVEKYKEALKASIPYIEFIAESAFKAERDLSSPKGKINVLNSVLPYLARVTNKIERAAYASRIAHRIELEDELILSELRKAVESQKTRIEQNKIVVSEIKPAEGKLLRTILDNAEFNVEIFSRIGPEDVEGLRTERILKAIINLHNQNKEINFSNLENLLNEDEVKLLIKVYFQEDLIASHLDEVLSCLSALKRSRLETYIKQLQTRIVEAEQRHDEEQLIRCYERKREVTQQLYALYQI